MNMSEASVIVRKGNACWKPLDGADTQREWLEDLLRFAFYPAKAAIDDLREQASVRYWPTMGEFKAAYTAVLARQPHLSPFVEGQRLLNGRVQRNDEANRALYGGAVEDWVYCWQCGMAVTLEERDTSARFREQYGFSHDHCPHRGARPIIPAQKRLERDEYWRKVGIAPSGTRRGAA